MDEDKIKSISNLISSADEDKIRKILRFRKRLTSSFEPEFIKKTISELVDNSENVDFVNDRAKKFIDPKQPVFKLNIPLKPETLKKYPDENVKNILKRGLIADISTSDGAKQLDSITNYKLMVLQEEIMNPLLTILFEKLEELEKSDEAARNEMNDIFKSMPEVKDLKRFLIPNIFKVLVESVKQDLVILEYIV
jgi:hypothetical protein